MSCCEGEAAKSAPALTPQEKLDKLLSGLPQIVLSSSDPDHPLASSIRNSMPITTPTQAVYAAPKVHDDGSIEYTPVDGLVPPPDINGYERDSRNPWVFRPKWGECVLRMAGVRKAVSGTIDVRMVCNNPQVTTFQKFVTADQCGACPARIGARKNPA